MAVRMGKAAVDFAAGQVGNPSRNWTGICLIFVRNCFNVGPVNPDAHAGYRAAKFKHGTAGTPPLGVPVWWTGGQHGHVAISTGDGNCFSSDIKRKGKIDKVPISLITRRWGMLYRGWTEDINGVRIWRPGAPSLPAVDLSNVREAATKDQFRPPGQGLHESDVIIVERALFKQGVRAPADAGRGRRQGLPQGVRALAEGDRTAAVRRDPRDQEFGDARQAPRLPGHHLTTPAA